jgi:hypothetical protein
VPTTTTTTTEAPCATEGSCEYTWTGPIGAGNYVLSSTDCSFGYECPAPPDYWDGNVITPCCNPVP